ncbi:1-acyl-sn-glycerol-3-phosphate acyltransferase [Blastopirellula sp. JC732]|uniref:1-acyl-sn-glycerol-3-phosphate acyltransferase n=1 Tax=Blastopirellula sediminis TaxID=2894196 RepID=A0A9X1ML94_9BACT|nr:lysophospholipid acyltransferase family protein [Blastopirellula sediminis]MCC9607619.1 1-acyl-sn-glycerol-3-phosphate acyltransferase [Blastopirellula sediminis]MCC9629088.1 1-acyl-sn-glycerol-3-phosphate acyltransferase [Blastopirellula sediminis]
MSRDIISAIFLTALLAIPTLWWLANWSRRVYTFPRYILACLNIVLARVWWRTSIPPDLPIPIGQGAVLIANHRSSADPFFIQVAAHRVVHWMVAKEFVEHPALAWFLRQSGAIGTSRGGRDTKAIRAAIDLLNAGELVGVLPEGRINMTDQLMLPFRPGAAMIAQHAGVPIVPIYIEGAPYDRSPASPFLMPAHVIVKVGEPIDSSTGTPQELMEQATRAIAHLAGCDDFQPQLAGRDWKPTPADLEAAMAAAKERKRNR